MHVGTANTEKQDRSSVVAREVLYRACGNGQYREAGQVIGGGTGGIVSCMWERPIPRSRERRTSLVSTVGWSRHLNKYGLDRLCCQGCFLSNVGQW